MAAITLVKGEIPALDRTWMSMPDGSTRQVAVHVVHDLPHLVVESLFGIEDGLWGVLARGGFGAANLARTRSRGRRARLRVRVASGKFWSDIAEQRLCAFGGRVLIAVTTVRTVCPCVVGVVAVAARMFSEEQLEQLRSFPDIGRDDLIRYFTLTQADMAFVDPGRGRGPADRLGLAVQLCTLPWLGFVPDEVSSAPPVAVARLADRLGLDPEVLEGYGRRSHTRSDHLLLVAKYCT